jgi:hypothetical protein|nr:MAG TPA: hypothetical protein [Caudoviricetes sp.]
MKKLYLNVVTQVVNEEGEELLERASGKKPKDVGGLTREWFTEQGLKPPSDLEDDIERDEDGAVFLDEKHLNYEALAVTIPLKNIDSWIEDSDIGSIIYMKSGLFYHVYETTEEIDDYVNYVCLTRLQELRINIKIWFENIFSQKKENKLGLLK